MTIFFNLLIYHNVQPHSRKQSLFFTNASDSQKRMKGKQTPTARRKGRKQTMLQIHHITFILLLSTYFSLLSAAVPSLPDPIQPFPLPSTPSIIPAFPSQSDVSSSSTSLSCQLTLPADVIHRISSSCSSARPARCCPSLSASLYSAYSSSALSLPPLALPDRLPDLPELPDDSESCSGQVEKALKAKQVILPRVNETCDMAYCKCGIRLRKLTCAGGGFFKDEVKGRWVATEVTGKMLERECRRPGISGCGRCIHALNQLSTNKSVASNSTQTNMSQDSKRECQLMGLTWLLNKNRTIYLPTAISVFRAFMAVSKPEEVSPATCSVPLDDLPVAVGANTINGSSTIRISFAMFIMITFIIIMSFI